MSEKKKKKVLNKPFHSLGEPASLPLLTYKLLDSCLPILVTCFFLSYSFIIAQVDPWSVVDVMGYLSFFLIMINGDNTVLPVLRNSWELQALVLKN
jgi:hypothetical protein